MVTSWLWIERFISFIWRKISAKYSNPWINSAGKLFWEWAVFSLKTVLLLLLVQSVASGFLFWNANEPLRGAKYLHILLPFLGKTSWTCNGWQPLLWYNWQSSRFLQNYRQCLRCLCMSMQETISNNNHRNFFFFFFTKTATPDLLPSIAFAPYVHKTPRIFLKSTFWSAKNLSTISKNVDGVFSFQKEFAKPKLFFHDITMHKTNSCLDW